MYGSCMKAEMDDRQITQRARRSIARGKWIMFDAISKRRAMNLQETMGCILTRGDLYNENEEQIEDCEELKSVDWKYEPEEEHGVIRELGTYASFSP